VGSTAFISGSGTGLPVRAKRHLSKVNARQQLEAVPHQAFEDIDER
jgi:hypothetical protein